MTPREEKKLVARLKAREERAFREFVELHRDRVFNLVYRMLGNREEAEDVSQEVFVTVFKAIGRFRGDSKLSTWVYRIAANHAKNRIKYLSRRKVDRQDSLEVINNLSSDDSMRSQPERMAIGREMERLAQRALASLDEDQRLIIVLRDVEQMSYEEIAEISGVALGTIKSRLHRARLAMQKSLKRLQLRGRRP